MRKLNSSMVRSANRWSKKLDDKELVDTLHCITTALHICETEKTADIFASMTIGISKSVEERFSNEEAAIILGNAMNFAEGVKDILLSLVKGKQIAMHLIEKAKENCNKCENKECKEEKDFNIQ